MQQAVAIGHNIPPADADPLLSRLREEHAALITRRDELLGGCERAPTEIIDEETAGKMADFVQKQIDPFLKRAEAIHKSEKEPFLSAGRTVDGFWHSLVDEMEKAKKRLNAIRKSYADKKAAEERKRLEEEARKAREEQDRLAKEAADAAAKLREEKELQTAIDAEQAAEAARQAAERAAIAAAAKPAILGRTRGEHGGMTTLKSFWNFSDLDRNAIDLEALRPHLKTEAIEQAIRSWIAANVESIKDGKKLAGVRIFEDTRL